ncbi:MAG TPA: DUF3489 domain-containing protein [Methyloceanibacter sp.]|nr:DUF3489 domain-containing protein [Methyloceanibacter sp.]
MTKSKTKQAKRTGNATKMAPDRQRADASRPGGKLGLIVDRLSTNTGVTANELVEVTGWQRHSVLGALSKLKSRGFAFHLDTHADRKAYRRTASKG